MNNNTKIRLRLSKNLFESITREILAEAKDMSGGAYTEAVKMPKAKKDPEVKATSKMKTMEEADVPKAPSHEETSANQVYERKKGHDVESLKKAKAKIEKRLAEIEANVAEDKIED